MKKGKNLFLIVMLVVFVLMFSACAGDDNTASNDNVSTGNDVASDAKKETDDNAVTENNTKNDSEPNNNEDPADDLGETKFLDGTWTYNKEVFYDIYGDGTYSLEVLGEETFGTYVFDGETINFTSQDGEESTVTYDESNNHLYADGLGALSPYDEEAAAAEIAKIVENEVMQNGMLSGVWSDPDVELTLNADGTYTMVDDVRSYNGTYTFTDPDIELMSDGPSDYFANFDSSENMIYSSYHGVWLDYLGSPNSDSDTHDYLMTDGTWYLNGDMNSNYLIMDTEFGYSINDSEGYGLSDGTYQESEGMMGYFDMYDNEGNLFDRFNFEDDVTIYFNDMGETYVKLLPSIVVMVADGPGFTGVTPLETNNNYKGGYYYSDLLGGGETKRINTGYVSTLDHDPIGEGQMLPQVEEDVMDAYIAEQVEILAEAEISDLAIEKTEGHYIYHDTYIVRWTSFDEVGYSREWTALFFDTYHHTYIYAFGTAEEAFDETIESLWLGEFDKLRYTHDTSGMVNSGNGSSNTGNTATLYAVFTMGLAEAGTTDNIKEYELEYDGELTVETLMFGLSNLIGLDFAFNNVIVDGEKVTVDWSADSTLIANMDAREQKDEFHMYDSDSMRWFMMDSLYKTIIENTDFIEVYYTVDGGKELSFEELSIIDVFPIDLPYMGSAFYKNHAGNAGFVGYQADTTNIATWDEMVAAELKDNTAFVEMNEVEINGEICIIYGFGNNETDKISVEKHFAKSPAGYAYIHNIVTDEWKAYVVGE